MGILRMSGGAVLWRIPGRAAGGAAPVITLQPVDGTFPAPHNVLIQATGVAPLSYQWQTFSVLPPPGAWVNLTDDSDFSGTTTATLTMLTPNGLSLRCVVTNAFGEAISNIALVATF